MALALSCALPITAQGDHTTPPEGVKSTATKRAAPASELRALAYQLLTIRPSDAETEIKALLKDTDDAVDLSKLAQDIRKFPSRLSDLKVQDSKGIFRPEGLAGPANETLANRLRIAWETARRRVEERANAAEPPRVFKNRAEYQEAIRQEVAKILKVADKDPVLQRVLELVAGDPAEILRRLGEQEKNREQKKAALTPEEDFALHLALAFFVTPQVRALKEAASISMSSAVLLLHGAEKSEDVESRAAVLIAKLAGLNADSRAATFKAVLDQFQVFDVDRPRVKFAGGSFGDVVFANASALVAALRSKELPKPTSGKGETLAVPESLPKSSGDPAFAQKILDRAKAAFAKATKTHGLLEANGTLLRKEGSLKAALEGKDSAKLHEYFDAAVEALSLVGTTPEKRDRLLTEFVCGTSWEKAFVLWSKEKKNPCEGRSAVANALKLGADPEKNSEAHQAKVRKALNNFAEAPEADGSPVGAAGPSGISQGEGPAGAEGPVAAPVRPYRGPKSGLAVREEESLAGGAALGGFGFGGSGGRSAVAAISDPPAPPTPAQVRLEDTDRDDGEAPRFGLARPATTPSPTETSPRPRVVTATPSPTPSPTRANASPTPSPTANGKLPSPTPTPTPMLEPTKPLFTPTPTETPTDVLPPIGALLNFNQTDGHTLVDASGRTIAVDPRTGSPLPGSQPAGAVQRRPAAAAAVPAIASGSLATSALAGAAIASPPVANVFVVNNPAPSVGVDNRALSSALAGKFSLDAASAKGSTVGGDRTRPVGMQSSYPPVGDGSGAWTPWKYGVITEPRVRPIYDPDNYRNLLWYESSRASENRPTEEQAKALKATELKARRSEFEADPMKGADKLRVVESATFVDKNGKVRGQAELRESSDGKDKLMRVAEVDPQLKGKVVRRRTERVTQLPNGAVVQVVVQFDEIYDAEGAAPRVVNKTITTTTVDKNHTVITKVQRVNQTTGEVTTSTTVQSNDTKFDWATFVQGLKAKR